MGSFCFLCPLHAAGVSPSAYAPLPLSNSVTEAGPGANAMATAMETDLSAAVLLPFNVTRTDNHVTDHYLIPCSSLLRIFSCFVSWENLLCQVVSLKLCAVSLPVRRCLYYIFQKLINILVYFQHCFDFP